MLGRYSESVTHNQEALRIAVRMDTLYGQSISVGNLGILACRHGDFVTAQACLEQVRRSCVNTYIHTYTCVSIYIYIYIYILACF